MSRLDTLNLEQISRFIASLNAMSKHHIGYCGEKSDEILDTLQHDFSDLNLEDCLAVSYDDEDEGILGVLGADVDLDNHSAELWGPFVNSENPEPLTALLWEEISSNLGKMVQTYHGFYNDLNLIGQGFIESLGGKVTGSHLILKAKKYDYTDEHDVVVEELSPKWHQAFDKLHNESFPDTYYTSEEIIYKVNDNNKVFVIPSGDTLLGYIYVEGNPDYEEGNIEFIAVSTDNRKRGIGTRLVKHALGFMFEDLGIEEISICVNEQNSQAINLYKRAGFKREHRLHHYVLNV
ncbi:GNAT family N-acetyltransferase [Rossellomorea marisflavi]|uniref:Uncharacterized protein n=1 Tax=Rossellomorea marisflavi TaxID=189381 RepID=A0A165L6K4_9BACI|nr:N-acetyltransferase [Rossellomorea marisflavi]KZE51145.1 hypothetical protein AV649_17440 [Rossellomorea marisflavi]TYO68863.1 GNAT family N-acetyltransferase [Rossellomorea marisflavi]UKS66016.1 GNAT family N-acetyltransferase [Rossellomorea marisflavi]USK92888.1 GNAT family N-acetyltransferase [Rossellomorea marisflavi]